MEHTNTCKNCGAVFAGQFCNNCGQQLIEERWNMKRLLRSASAVVFNLEKGFFHTFKHMLLHPSMVIKDYLNGKTICYTNPFRYAVLCIAASVFISLGLGIWDIQMEKTIETYRTLGMVDSEASEERMRKIFGVVSKLLNFIPLFIFPFMAWSTRLFYKKHGFHYAEHLIMVAFITGQATLYSIFSYIFAFFVPNLVSWTFGFGVLASTIVYGQTFRGLFKTSRLEGFAMGLLAYLLGFLAFLLTIMILGFMIGIIVGIIYAKMKG